jgi:ribosome-associated protein
MLAIAEAIEERLSEDLRIEPGHVEGRRGGGWVLLDYIDFVVHVFIEEKRSFYALERLWGDAPRLDLPAEGPSPARRAARGRKARPSATG